MFLTEKDYKAVSDAQTLGVIEQADEENRGRAERYAIEEVSSYLRGRYDMEKAYKMRYDNRNAQLVMITADIALYHLIAWLPKRMGFEIREIRYKQALNWLRDVQNGKSSPDLPTITDDSGNETGGTIKYGSMKKNRYDY